MWSVRSRSATRAPRGEDHHDLRRSDRCTCEQQVRLPVPVIGAFINHHRRPIARLAPDETDRARPVTLVRGRLVEPGGSPRLLVGEVLVGMPLG
jgi:hypothetical protein